MILFVQLKESIAFLIVTYVMYTRYQYIYGASLDQTIDSSVENMC